ncbi:MAG: UDP-N-acetylmuramoyl-L-alanine--D-glutamate ligase [Ruminococcaceae bacterium]|nr:UDP-N-acetylmuramoyl-L-alanine--D-glutamate ligase [Oscillospiraceae bacterium]
MSNKQIIQQQLKQAFGGKAVDVVGLGISNLPLIDVLLDAGAAVTARDRRDEAHFEKETADALRAKGVRLILGDRYLDSIKGETVFRSPGLRPDLPAFEQAKAAGASLTSEMELFLSLCPAKTVGITGSNGKTTTTTLTHRFLEASGKRAYLGGNIGRPLLPQVFEMTEDDFAVLELSSFQLFGMKHSTERALITNLSPNHLDYHTDMDEYVAAKKAIYQNRENKRLILNGSDERTPLLVKEAAGRVSFFNSDEAHGGVYEKDGMIFCNGKAVLPASSILLRGRHNAENYMAAIALTEGDADQAVIEPIAKTFAGVEHRLEFVEKVRGVSYYNGSIDSSPSRTAAALSAFDERLVVICGGYDKHIPYEPLGAPLCEKARVLILTGATGLKIREAVISCPSYDPNKTAIFEEADLEAAVKRASKEAKEGESVLLSPASASFDAFKNFEERGRAFKSYVRAL